MTPAMTEWDQLITKACVDMQARTDNHGDWPNGIPDTFYKIREIRKIEEPHGWGTWVSVVENIVKNEAIRIIAQTQQVIDETWGKLQDQLFTDSVKPKEE